MTRIAITNGDTAGSTRRAATHYGPVTVVSGVPSTYVDDASQVMEIPFAFSKLPTYGADKIVQAIPEGAHIDSVDFVVTTAFAGGTSYAVGLYEADGTAIDADGLVTDVNAPVANIGAAGDVVHGSGALVGTALAAEGQVKVTATGTFTAGEGVIVVKFTPLRSGIDTFNS